MFTSGNVKGSAFKTRLKVLRSSADLQLYVMIHLHLYDSDCRSANAESFSRGYAGTISGIESSTE